MEEKLEMGDQTGDSRPGIGSVIGIPSDPSLGLATTVVVQNVWALELLL